MKLRAPLLAALATLVWATAAGAAGGHGGSDAHHGPTQAQWILLGCAAINFGIFVLLMRRFTRKPLADFLSGRRAEVKEAIEAAAKAKDEAERLKAEYERRAKEVEEERRRMIEEMRSIAEADRVKALAAARETADRLGREAERAAAGDLERAKRELREEAVRLATVAARERIRADIAGADQKRLLNEFLQGVDRQI